MDVHRHSVWKCRCDCGNIVFASSNSLRQGKTQSCGCFRHELTILNNRKVMTKHGQSASRLYNIWAQMKQRCSNENNKNFRLYGDRGIFVCQEWESFEPFFQWAMSTGYEPSLTLDRIDVNGDYCPENCRWATNIEQGNNKRNTVYATINGEKRPIAEWARLYGIDVDTIRDRLKHGKCDADLVRPTRKQKEENKWL